MTYGELKEALKDALARIQLERYEDDKMVSQWDLAVEELMAVMSDIEDGLGPPSLDDQPLTIASCLDWLARREGIVAHNDRVKPLIET